MGHNVESTAPGRWERLPPTSRRRRRRLLPICCGFILCLSCAESWLTSPFFDHPPPYHMHMLKRRERFRPRQQPCVGAASSSGRRRSLALPTAPAAPAIEMVSLFERKLCSDDGFTSYTWYTGLHSSSRIQDNSCHVRCVLQSTLQQRVQQSIYCCTGRLPLERLSYTSIERV